MASLKRSKTMPADGQTARFLYTILKQLDLKPIDWGLVAQQLEITNGHAARMRYSRFKQHMEGTATNPRGPRKRPKAEKAATQLSKKQKMFSEDRPEAASPEIKPEPMIKPEPVVDPLLTYGYPLANSGLYMPSPYTFGTVAPSDLTLQCPAPPPPMGYHMPPTGDQYSRIKMEQFNHNPSAQETMVKREPQEGN